MSESLSPRRSALVDRLVGGLWLGAGVFILLTASAVFEAAGSPVVGANVVGTMITRWHYIAILAPVFLLLSGWRQVSRAVMTLLVAAVLLALVQWVIDARIRQIRSGSPVPISSLDRTDPVRRRFGMLHGASSLLLVAEVIAAAGFLAMDRER